MIPFTLNYRLRSIARFHLHLLCARSAMGACEAISTFGTFFAREVTALAGTSGEWEEDELKLVPIILIFRLLS